MFKTEPTTDAAKSEPTIDAGDQEELRATDTMASGGSKTVVRPRDFDGKDNVRRFLHKFEQCAKVNGWDKDDDKLGQLAVSLVDKAYDFFMHLPEDSKSTYDKLHKALMTEFDSPGLQSDYALQLSSCHRKGGQSTADFLHELQELAERAYPDWGDVPRQGIVKAQFINGLGSELRTQLMLQAPEDESVEDLERRTRRIEQVCGASPSTSSVGRMEANPSLSQQMQELRDQVSTVSASLAQLQAGVGRLTFGTGQRRARGRGGYRGRGGQGGRGGGPVGACFRCGVNGHFARDCTAGQVQRGGVCYRCGQPGHIARDCCVTGGFQ